MAKLDVRIEKVPAGMEALKSARFHCAAPIHHADRHPLQVRITARGGRPALFTVVADSGSLGVVFMGRAARDRLEADAGVEAELDTVVPRGDLTIAEASERGEFVEETIRGQESAVIVIAPHGGLIEAHTDMQAKIAVEALEVLSPSAWICRGYGGGLGAFERWHITSTELSERSFPGLAEVMGRDFSAALAFHGKDDGGDRSEDVLIGGRAPDALKQEIGAAIMEATAGAVSFALAGDGPLSGSDPKNIVNRLGCRIGVQLEQSKRARRDHAAAIARAAAAVLRRSLSSAPVA